MKKSKFTDSQILSILKQAEGGAVVPELCREHVISSATFYKWRDKYGGMDASITNAGRWVIPPFLTEAKSRGLGN